MKVLRIITTLIAFLWLTTGNTEAGVFDRSAEVEEYLKVLNAGDIHASIEVCQKIYYSGITDKKLFDLINKKLLESYPMATPNDRDYNNYVGWLTKALGSSGHKEYEPTITTVLMNSRVQITRNHAKSQLGKIGWFEYRNRIMASTANHQEGADPHVSRHLNLLLSDDMNLKRYAAEQSNSDGMTDTRIYDVMEQELLKALETPRKDKLYIDMTAWFCRALGSSGDVKYKNTILKAHNTPGVHTKIKKHAKMAFNKLKG